MHAGSLKTERDELQSATTSSGTGSAMTKPPVDAATAGLFGSRILTLADQLARWSEAESGLTCTYLSKAHRDAAAQLAQWMRDSGMVTEIDAVGNVVGRYAGA